MTWEHYTEKVFKIREGDVVTATDPCYDSDVPSAYLHLPAGEYDCMYDMVDEGDWGMRVAKCAILKKGAGAYIWDPDDALRQYAGSTGVDAGLAGFFINKPDYDDSAWDRFCKDLRKADKEDMQRTGRKYKNVYHTPEGFFTSSGFGDGEYNVYILDTGKEIVGAMIIFISDECEDTYCDEGCMEDDYEED